MRNAESKTTIYRKDYSAPDYWIDKLELSFDITQDQTQVDAKLSVRRNSSRKAAPLVLQGVGLELRNLEVNGQALAALDYEVDDEQLTIHQPPEEFLLTSRCLIRPDQNTALEGFYRSGQFLLTQCEAEGFRKITYFLDRPDVMAKYQVRIEADQTEYPVLLSNGNCIDSGDLADNRHFALWEDPFPKPSYLFALVAGDLSYLQDSYHTTDGRQVDLKIYTEPENLDKLSYAMDSLKRSMSWDEERFGLVYDLDIYNIVATNDFNMGAMENKSLNIFNAKYVLASPETATDVDYQNIEAVIGHEYFHNWTGNRVTCRDWFQLSLKEGLTVFRDQEFSSDSQSRAVKRIEDVRALRSLQFPEDNGPMSHPVRPDAFIEINNFYTLTIYEKGAEVVRMYHTLLGEEGFQRGMQLYFERHDGQAVTCDDFRMAMADANAVDLTQFETWYCQSGTPVVEAKDEYDPETQTYRLLLTQQTPATPDQEHKAALHMPLRLGLLNRQGNEISLRPVDAELKAGGDVLELTQASQEFVFEQVSEKPIPSLFRGFSAPVKLEYPYSDEQLAFLMAHDTDPFNRWDASQSLAGRVILNSLGDSEAQHSQQIFTAAAASTLNNEALDPALVAATLTLPAESYLAELMSVVNVDGIHRSRQALLTATGLACAEKILEVYQLTPHDQPYRNDPASIGRRALKNLCLGYLGLGCKNHDLVQRQYQAANNMTDTMAALQILVHNNAPQCEQALASFYERWRHDPLVMDKWLQVQATAPGAETLHRVKQLMSNPVFTLKNPNKVRSLLTSFARINPTGFHLADGSAYEFIADQVLALDALNPQIAARLIAAFNAWRRYDTNRANLMQAQLNRITASKSLSKDVYEIASKALL